MNRLRQQGLQKHSITQYSFKAEYTHTVHIFDRKTNVDSLKIYVNVFVSLRRDEQTSGNIQRMC